MKNVDSVRILDLKIFQEVCRAKSISEVARRPEDGVDLRPLVNGILDRTEKIDRFLEIEVSTLRQKVVAIASPRSNAPSRRL